MRDLCIHRGTALSLGWIADDCLVCPYHAWRYDASGACVRIPQSASATIPGKARTPVYPVPGALRPRLGVPRPRASRPTRCPRCPSSNPARWKVVNTGPFAWHSDASRQVENFTDFGHFPWVHPGLLGDPEPAGGARPQRGHASSHVLHYTIVRPEAPNSDDFQVFANTETREAPERRSRYELHLPYTIVLQPGLGRREGDGRTSSPRSRKPPGAAAATASSAATTTSTTPTRRLQEFERVIFGQDQRIVESQRP